MTVIKDWWSRQDSLIWMSYIVQVFTALASAAVCVLIYNSITTGHYNVAIFNFFVALINVYSFLSLYYTRRRWRMTLRRQASHNVFLYER